MLVEVSLRAHSWIVDRVTKEGGFPKGPHIQLLLMKLPRVHEAFPSSAQLRSGLSTIAMLITMHDIVQMGVRAWKIQSEMHKDLIYPKVK